MEQNETVGQAAQRELLEETGIAGLPVTQLFTYSKPGRDPRTWVITVTHIALVPVGEQPQVVAGDDASGAAWFTWIVEKREGRYYLTLEGNGETLWAELAHGGIDADGYEILSCTGIAFDHAKMLIAAAKELGITPN